MPPVFAHGRLRLYLLKLLDESPRHGYEVIRLLEERFHGLYAPSAGTVYPRLAKLEAEGLVTHTTEGGRKVYSLTDAGRAELAGRSGELADLEQEIRASVSELAAEIRADVRGAAGKLRSEMRAAASETRKDSWREQARRAKEESHRAREEAKWARRQAEETQEKAREEVQRLAQQVHDHLTTGEWPAALSDLTGRLGGLGGLFGGTPPAAPTAPTAPRPPYDQPADDAPAWQDIPTTENPARDLERLLDRFRDDIRDAARDHGVTPAQLAESRRHLSTAAAHIAALLRGAPRN
ncbi:helix-turn-helix transcriptional regulator [Streptomyces sp. NPDC045431]|uniref:PadR family transcriptional regulator n=1 Tax=Streptomyces sp. NPDC045431 TaxID=3155613 RepID=UPI00340E9B57